MARPTQPETPQRLSVAGARGYASPDEDDDDVLMSGRRSRGGQRGRPSRLDSDIAAGLSGMGVDDSIGVVLPQRKLGKYASPVLVIAGLMVGAWYLGKGGPRPTSPSAPAAAPAPAGRGVRRAGRAADTAGGATPVAAPPRPRPRPLPRRGSAARRPTTLPPGAAPPPRAAARARGRHDGRLPPEPVPP